MKNLLLIFSVLLSTSLSAVEINNYSLGANQKVGYIYLAEGDYIEIMSVAYNQIQPRIVLFSYNPDASIDNYNFDSHLGYKNVPTVGEKFYGPINIAFFGDTGSGNWGRSYISTKTVRATEVQYQNNNINIVSVPSDVQGAGTHNIVVETSSDLINWTPVHSSAISGGSEAFVRTRISTSE